MALSLPWFNRMPDSPSRPLNVGPFVVKSTSLRYPEPALTVLDWNRAEEPITDARPPGVDNAGGTDARRRVALAPRFPSQRVRTPGVSSHLEAPT